MDGNIQQKVCTHSFHKEKKPNPATNKICHKIQEQINAMWQSFQSFIQTVYAVQLKCNVVYSAMMLLFN